jgi:hypothetical protein
LEHPSDHELERYHLGMVKNLIELAALEDHVITCAACAERAQESAEYVDIRAGIIQGNFDLPKQNGASSTRDIILVAAVLALIEIVFLACMRFAR